MASRRGARGLGPVPARPRHLTDFDDSTFILLTNAEIENLPASDRARYVERLHGHYLDHGREASPYFHEWLRYDARCRHDDCDRERYAPHMFCIPHLDLDTIDPEAAMRQRALRARWRLTDLAERAVDDLERMLSTPPDEMPAAVRLKLLAEIFDRGGVVRQTAASLDVTADIKVSSEDPAEVIRGRLARLGATFIDGEIANLERGLDTPPALNRGTDAEPDSEG